MQAGKVDLFFLQKINKIGHEQLPTNPKGKLWNPLGVEKSRFETRDMPQKSNCIS